jgi:hypothetical protein
MNIITYVQAVTVPMNLPSFFLLQIHVVASKLAEEIKFPHGDHWTKNEISLLVFYRKVDSLS